MTITQANSSQQSNKLPNSTAKNTKKRSKEIDVSLFATMAKASQQGTKFYSTKWILFKYDTLGRISKSHVSRRIKEFIEFGIFIKNELGHYKLTTIGEKILASKFKTHIGIIVDLKRHSKEEVHQYLKFVSELPSTTEGGSDAK